MLIAVGTAEAIPGCVRLPDASAAPSPMAALAPHEADVPQYAVCVLIDRPSRRGARDALTVSVFDVGLYGSLRVISRRPWRKQAP